MQPLTVERPRMCALCLTTVARRGSLCHTCADEMDQRDSYEFSIANRPCCPTCGGVLERNEFCGWCDHQRVRAENEWKLVHA